MKQGFSKTARTFARAIPQVARVMEEREDLARRLSEVEDERRQLERVRRQLVERSELLRRNLQSGARSLRDPSSFEYVFIVTYGRTGSTLLQGILDSTPGFLIRGENRAALYHLYQFHESCKRERRRVRGDVPLDSSHPWYGMDEFPGKLALEQLRTLVLDTLIRPAPDSRVVGFKEIRWQQKDLSDYVAFVVKLFPQARFVFNTRRHEDVAKSKWWADGVDPLREIRRVEGLQRSVADSLGNAAFRVHYNDYVADPTALRGLFDWLGEEFDEARIRSVMRREHSY